MAGRTQDSDEDLINIARMGELERGSELTGRVADVRLSWPLSADDIETSAGRLRLKHCASQTSPGHTLPFSLLETKASCEF